MEEPDRQLPGIKHEAQAASALSHALQALQGAVLIMQRIQRAHVLTHEPVRRHVLGQRGEIDHSNEGPLVTDHRQGAHAMLARQDQRAAKRQIGCHGHTPCQRTHDVSGAELPVVQHLMDQTRRA